MGRRSRKRARPAAERVVEPAPAPTTRKEREKRRRDALPPPPWAPFPLVELAVLAALIIGAIGFFSPGRRGAILLVCAAALGSLETMAKEDLAARARRIGDIMLPRLREIATATAAIADVRGRGAMLAVEIVRPGGIEPDPATAAQVAAACHQAGLLVLTCGTFGNVLRFLPPMVIGEPLLDEGLSILAEAFAGR